MTRYFQIGRRFGTVIATTRSSVQQTFAKAFVSGLLPDINPVNSKVTFTISRRNKK